MKFLVTGGTGFIGKRVVAQLLQRNINVIATDINIDKEKMILKIIYLQKMFLLKI